MIFNIFISLMHNSILHIEILFTLHAIDNRYKNFENELEAAYSKFSPSMNAQEGGGASSRMRVNRGSTRTDKPSVSVSEIWKRPLDSYVKTGWYLSPWPAESPVRTLWSPSRESYTSYTPGLVRFADNSYPSILILGGWCASLGN